MFAIVRTGGKQYRVHPGDKIVVEKLDGNAGDKVTLGDVLLAGDGGNLKKTGGLTVVAPALTVTPSSSLLIERTGVLMRSAGPSSPAMRLAIDWAPSTS